MNRRNPVLAVAQLLSLQMGVPLFGGHSCRPPFAGTPRPREPELPPELQEFVASQQQQQPATAPKTPKAKKPKRRSLKERQARRAKRKAGRR